MGESKRRAKLDPNYGRTKIVQNACRYIDRMLQKQRREGWTQKILFCMFTNQDRGCTKQELELLEKEIPRRYQGREVHFWVLPREYAGLKLPEEEVLNYFVPIEIEYLPRKSQ